MSVVAPKTVLGRPVPVKVRQPGERRSLSRSATRALDVMELFGQARRPLRAIEISRSLAIHPSTTDQLLKTMVDSSHLVFDGQTKCYSPSPRLVDFGGWIVDLFGTEHHIHDLMREVLAKTGVMVTLTTPHDLFMQVLDVAVPSNFFAQRGTRISLFGSAVGSAYLSTLDDGEIRRLADRARIPEAEVPRVLGEVDGIRRDGFADGPTGEGELWSIARPLPRAGDALAMVLGLAGPTEYVRSNREALQAHMADGIARWIGANHSEGGRPNTPEAV